MHLDLIISSHHGQDELMLVSVSGGLKLLQGCTHSPGPLQLLLFELPFLTNFSMENQAFSARRVAVGVFVQLGEKPNQHQLQSSGVELTSLSWDSAYYYSEGALLPRCLWSYLTKIL